MADILAGCYAVTHNYALAIALLTVAVVAVTTPLTWKSTRGMLAMQMLAPEIKKLQQKYKNDKETLNREMMALYKENSINPLGGCLPLLPQMVVFFVLYRTIYNISHKLTFTTLAKAQAHCGNLAQHLTSGVKNGQAYACADPQNVSHGSLLYHNLVAAGGHMKVWGFDLTLGVRTAHGSAVVGCWILVVLVVGAYYFQTRQMSSRNPQAAAANPQMQSMQKIFPLFFGLISITIQAGVNVYFLVSALCRIGQQSLMYRHDPVLRRQVENARNAAPIDVASKEKKGFFASLMTPPGGQPPAKRPPNTPGRGGSGPASRGSGPATTGRGSGGAAGNGRPGNGTGGNGTSARPATPKPPAEAGAPRGTLARIWAAASGATTTEPTTTRPQQAPPAPAAPAADASAGNGAEAAAPPTPPRPAARSGPAQKPTGPPRPNQRNRSRAKRRRK
ncbi:MAG TPA: YidC/Oxa1 family membrane protein insertase [Acidimicrobiales bacterium]|nr:YidC/Oxa1 family membrane protein insertase [Acidimicrobiales bacterium]